MKVKLLALVIFFLWVVPAFAQVDTAWVRRYNGPANGWDNAYAIAVDNSGNVYVTGSSAQNSGYPYNYDYATIKYYPNGDTAWVRRYNGPGDTIDIAEAIAVDGSGNVYVTGHSVGSDPYGDYATIKYYPNGDTAWVRRYNGPDNSWDFAYAIAIDGSGNVCVTGWSNGSATGQDYVTIKYSPNGDTAWVRRYNGPENGRDEAVAIAIDNSNHVFVTGYSGSYPDLNYVTIKYYSNGDTAWVRKCNGPANQGDYASAIAVDDSSNVYVTGQSMGSGTADDYATVKYYPNGNTAWVRRYNGPADSTDIATAIAVDGSGNVYVTGQSMGTGSDDYATVKYDPNGNEVWVKRYNGPGNGYDRPEAIAIDGSDNIYVTGNSYGSGTNQDYTTIKYSPGGDTAWVRRYNGASNLYDYASAIAVDGSNHVYLTGYSYGSGTYYDYATIKYIQYLTEPLTVVAFSPVDIIVTDPGKDSVGLSFSTIPGATYDTTQDWNHDNDKDDIITIPHPLVGRYMIRVFPEPVKAGTYSLGIRIDGGTMVMLASNHSSPPPGSADNYSYNAPWYKRGDVNSDWVINLFDVVYLISYLYKSGPAPFPLEAGDATCEGLVNLGDIVYLINYLFKGGPAPSC
jgi:hypothetical protein